MKKTRTLKKLNVGVRVKFKPYKIGEIPRGFDKHDRHNWVWFNDKGLTWIYKID
tara:strand:+ start:2247 stop:2408 length:162 start_codon:yes stop_codon:yes gene_type:complete